MLSYQQTWRAATVLPSRHVSIEIAALLEFAYEVCDYPE
jgi:hypothetical protein